MKEHVEEQLTKNRVELDIIISAISTLRSREDIRHEDIGRELSLAITKLETGRMWVGELYSITGKYPYVGTNEATTVEGIHDAVDVATNAAKVNMDIALNGNYIEALGKLRKQLDNIHDTTVSFTQDYINQGSINVTQCFSNTFMYLREGRMYLGVAMDKIRDNGKH